MQKLKTENFRLKVTYFNEYTKDDNRIHTNMTYCLNDRIQKETDFEQYEILRADKEGGMAICMSNRLEVKHLIKISLKKCV